MRLRDLPFAPYDQIALLDGLTPSTIAALPAALEAYAEEVADDLRLPARARGASAVLERLPDGRSPVQLASRARTRAAAARRGFPFTVTASGDRVAITVPHRLMDGHGLVELLRVVLGEAAGQPVAVDRAQPVPHPYRTMLRTHLTRDLLRRARAAPSPGVPGPVLHPPTADDRARLTASSAAVVLTPQDLTRLAGTEARGTSAGMRAGSLALGALQRVHRGGEDITVELPIDLRRWAPRGRIAGNFVTVGPAGTLLGSDWSAKAIGTVMTADVRSKLPIVRSARWLAHTVAHLPADRLRARRPARTAARAAVSLSLLGGPADLPEAAWLPGSDRALGMAVTGPEWPSSTFVMVLTLGAVVRVSVWDESGLFDLAAFPEALQQELAAREAALPRA